MAKKFIYQTYDYSFLREKNDKYHWIPNTIKLYEPVRDINGTWTMTLTPPQTPTYIRNYDDFVKAYTATSNYIAKRSRRGKANYIVTNSTVANIIKTK